MGEYRGWRGAVITNIRMTIVCHHQTVGQCEAPGKKGLI